DWLDAAGAGQADPSLRMRAVLVGKALQGCQHRPRSEHLEVAERRVGHLAGQVAEEVEVARARCGGQDAVERLHQPPRPDPAWDRLSTRLPRREVQEEARGVD